MPVVTSGCSSSQGAQRYLGHIPWINRVGDAMEALSTQGFDSADHHHNISLNTFHLKSKQSPVWTGKPNFTSAKMSRILSCQTRQNKPKI